MLKEQMIARYSAMIQDFELAAVDCAEDFTERNYELRNEAKERFLNAIEELLEELYEGK